MADPLGDMDLRIGCGPERPPKPAALRLMTVSACPHCGRLNQWMGMYVEMCRGCCMNYTAAWPDKPVADYAILKETQS